MKICRLIFWVVVCFRIKIFAVLIILTSSLVSLRAEDELPGSHTSIAPLSPEEQRKKFHLPPGFEIQLVASEPQIQKPVNLNFDAQGRLFVTTTTEYPIASEEKEGGRDFLWILSDLDVNGRAQKIVPFVDRLNIPMGVVPIPKGALVYSIPNIYRCLDIDGDGKADSREPIYGAFQYFDTHGMSSSYTRWIDGWVYGCHGFGNDSEVKGSDGHAIQMHWGSTYRFRLDGSHIEYFTHGQTNPFGITIDSLGNIYDTDSHSQPIYMLLRGGYYPGLMKSDDGLGFAPAMTDDDHGSTGFGGVAYYAAEHFPKEYRDNVFIGNVVTGRVHRDSLLIHGSTYRTVKQPDFITCDDPWFRPVNIHVGPDGALYVADFYNCVIAHVEVSPYDPHRDRTRGRIWRVVWKGLDGKAPPPKPMPDLTSLSPKDLIEELANSNLIIRTLATNQLIDHFGKEAVPLIKNVISKSTSAYQRAHGLWVLERLGALDDVLIGKMAQDPDRIVRVHLMKALGERVTLDQSKLNLIVKKLEDKDAFVRRAAADALGLHADLANIDPLIKLWNSTPNEDAELIYMARIALRDQLLEPGVYSALSFVIEKDPNKARQLVEVSFGIQNSESARFLLSYMQKYKPELKQVMKLSDSIASSSGISEQSINFLEHVAKNASEQDLLEVFAFSKLYQKESIQKQLMVINSLNSAAQISGKPLPDDMIKWTRDLALQLLAQKDENLLKAGIELVQQVKLVAAYDILEKIAASTQYSYAFRVAALKAAFTINPKDIVAVFDKMIGDPDADLGFRQNIAQLIGELNSQELQQVLMKHIPTVPYNLAVVMAAGVVTSGDPVEFFDKIEKGKISPLLLQEWWVETSLRNAQIPNFDKRLADLTAGLPTKSERMNELIAQRITNFASAKPNPANGRKVFERNCMVCHRIGKTGGNVGPNLDAIGTRGLDRLVEDVLNPNQNVDPAFWITIVETKDGRHISGSGLHAEGQVLMMMDDEGQQVKIPLQDIKEKTVQKVSLMPPNWADVISEGDFQDLMGYLLSEKGSVAAVKK